MFVDYIRVHARAGDGGNGVIHFIRRKFQPKGGPDGGDGGDGGDIVLKVSNNVDNLKAFFYDPKVYAEKGGIGGAEKCHGKKGRVKKVLIPPGTTIYRCPDTFTIKDALEKERTEGDDFQLEYITDLVEEGAEFTLCKGGKGGKGNWHFKSSTNQAPEEFTLGEEGVEGIFYFELKRIADAGLVGFPNAGKSTLLGKLSGAQPKVASYPFTTLNPIVGVVDFPGYQRCVLADIPGIIAGAHENKGLGLQFLRHIQRCQVLLFVVDLAAVDGRDAISDIQILRQEIKEYDQNLAKYPWLIVANKIDVAGAEEQLALLQSRFPKITIFAISAKEEQGLEDLKQYLSEHVAHNKFNSKKLS